MVYDPSKRIDAEQALMRRLTASFIANDPTDIVLTPNSKIGLPDGGYRWAAGPKRKSQSFKIINQGSSNGKQTGADGTNTSFDFVLLGRHDAVLAIGDTWVDNIGDGTTWTITGFLPANGYEVKATVTAQGRKTIGG